MASPIELSTMTSDAPPVDEWPSSRLAWTALVLLMLGLIVSCLDRVIITLLVEPIKADYGLSDTQFGALQSLAFGAFYISFAIPIGILADRYQRRLVIAIGVAFFNVFSILTGFAGNYFQLFLARMGVGVGEASVAPAGYSLISDYFPPSKLGRAMSLFIASNYIGASLALIVGGALVGWFDQIYALRPHALYGLQPWQATIIAVALPGLLLAPCYLMLREPARRGLVGTKQNINFKEMLHELGKRRSVLFLLIGAAAMASTMAQAVTMWMPALFIRVYGWSVSQIGLWFGFLMLAGGVFGSLSAGWLTDRLAVRKMLDAPIIVTAVSFAAVGVFGVIAPLMPTAELALLCFVPVIFLKPMAFAVMPTALQLITPNQLRGQVGALYQMAITLTGVVFGAVIVGMMTDYLFNGTTGVRYSLSLISAVTVPVMILLMILVRRPYRQLREADQ